jgi:hypothetical protein
MSGVWAGERQPPLPSMPQLKFVRAVERGGLARDLGEHEVVGSVPVAVLTPLKWSTSQIRTQPIRLFGASGLIGGPVLAGGLPGRV